MGNTNGVTRFGVLAREVFSWDADIQWIALDDPGRRTQVEWRDPNTRPTAAVTRPEALTVDPLLLMLAEDPQDARSGGTRAGERDLRFVVLAYRHCAQVVARFGQYGYLNIGVCPAADAYRVGTRLAELLDRSAKVAG